MCEKNFNIKRSFLHILGKYWLEVFNVDNAFSLQLSCIFCRGSERGYMESLVLGGHAGFVSSVAVLPPDESNIHGIILTGSNDHTINAYTLDSPSPIYTLKGHEGNG